MKHRFVHFVLNLFRYIGGFVWFVVSLRKGYYMRQFSLFAWTHVALLIIVTQSYLIIQVIISIFVKTSIRFILKTCCYIKIYDNNISLFLKFQNLFEGLIWFILPIMMIIINDVMAYMFGFFLGRTPLIKLSPKKTWEGYLGGGVRPLDNYHINI